MLNVIVSDYFMQFQGKLMNQIWKMAETGFGPNFGRFWSKSGPRRTFLWVLLVADVESYHCIQFEKKLMNRTWENSKKLSSETNFGSSGQFFFFFFTNLAPSVTRHHGQRSSCTISEKINDPILRKRSDDRRTDWREWFHRTLPD